MRLTDAGGGAGTWTVRLARAGGDDRHGDRPCPASSTVPPGGEADAAGRRARGRRRADRRGLRLRRAAEGNGHAARPVPLPRRPPALAAAPVDAAPAHAGRRRGRAAARTPSRRTAIPSRRSATSPTSRRCTRTARRRSTSTSLDRPAVNIGVSILDRATARGSTRSTSARRTRTRCRASPARRSTSTRSRTTTSRRSAPRARRSRARAATTSRSTPARDPFTAERLAGRYVLRSWVNDVTPPSLQLLTTRGLRRTADARLPVARHAVGRRSGVARRSATRASSLPSAPTTGDRARRLPAAARACPRSRPARRVRTR